MSSASEIVEQINRLVSELAAKTAAPAQRSSQPTNAKKLTKREVARIRELKRNGFTQKAIADIFDCHPATISRIVRGQHWR